MPSKNFNVRTINSIKPPSSSRIEYWDDETHGFGLRVSQTGRKTWIVLYRHHGRLRRLTLGTYPPLSLADAREQAKDALRAAAKGKDPASEKQADRERDAALRPRWLKEVIGQRAVVQRLGIVLNACKKLK